MHFRDAGLPLLFVEAFVLMGAFVTLFNYIGYRLLAEPYHMDQAFVGLLSVVYLSGIYSSAKIGALADQLGRRKVLWATIVVMLAGLALTMFTPLPVVIFGMLVFTFGFFGAHSVASSWIGRRATKAKGRRRRCTCSAITPGRVSRVRRAVWPGIWVAGTGSGCSSADCW